MLLALHLLPSFLTLGGRVLLARPVVRERHLASASFGLDATNSTESLALLVERTAARLAATRTMGEEVIELRRGVAVRLVTVDRGGFSDFLRVCRDVTFRRSRCQGRRRRHLRCRDVAWDRRAGATAL